MISPLFSLTAALAIASAPVPHQALPSAPLAPAASVPSTQPGGAYALRFDWKRDGALTAGAAALLLGSEVLLKDKLARSTCNWCDRNDLGESTLNAVDRWGARIAGDADDQRQARTWSNVVTVGLLPAGVLGAGYLAGRSSGSTYLTEDLLMVAQAVLFSSSANQVVKFAAGRARPFVHGMPEAERGLTESPSDNNMSFYSGHTNLAFALVTSVGTVAHLRGYKNAGWIWAVGLPLAATVPVLRMAAGKHYLSDVATGALVGSAFGVLVPLLMHPRGSPPPGILAGAAANEDVEKPRVNVSAGAGGISVSGVF
ncbi:MAG TPA: phosphatase PAP2 family protein [Aggregicoccus sp.]|nr:phosphatase PAP2 family protein [Aggregicoccus sp.]